MNNHRLTATSTIRNASGAILVDYVPVAGPYEVVAIGPDDLEERFAGSETAALMRLLADRYGISYDLRFRTRPGPARLGYAEVAPRRATGGHSSGGPHTGAHALRR